MLHSYPTTALALLIWCGRVLIALVCISIVWAIVSNAKAYASCATMQALAQEHSDGMARRHSMDHSGFDGRARRGARAENVALASSKEQAMQLWRNSPAHAANMMRPGCKAVANSGRYWTMEIGP